MSRFKALCASLRLPNAPSVVSNVVLGYYLAIFSIYSFIPFFDGYIELLKIIFAALFLYFSGNLANDWHDRKWDIKHRPERALPSGLFSPKTYLFLALAFAITGIFLSFLTSIAAGYIAIFLAIMIVIYTVIHKRTAWGTLPMGICRALLYPLGFLAFDYFIFWRPSDILYIIIAIGPYCLGLLSYITGLSLAARCESLETKPLGMLVLARCMLFFPVIAMSTWIAPAFPIYTIIAVIPLIAWLTYSIKGSNGNIPRLVSCLLAGIPLVDFIAAFPIGMGNGIFHGAVLPEHESPWMLDGLIIICTPIVAFVMSRLLQKFVSAT